jgi:prepilin-type processing-associated H-X9-DG protein/prepilin-type N-terminal cleavage/methylation domain-containing protein
VVARPQPAFTLIELLVVVGIIGLLISILVPALAAARAKSRDTKCLANLHVLGHGIVLYANDNDDALMPSRLPKLGSCDAYADINGGRKYRPTFLAMLSMAVNLPPFLDPQACKTQPDRFGEPGDQQNYAYGTYVCPTVAEWTDERNGSYGWNYQFLGNSRLWDSEIPTSYKHWSVQLSLIRYPGTTVAVADSMGTAATWPPGQRHDYMNNGRDPYMYGDEGFNLDPPRVDTSPDGEWAYDGDPWSRTAVHDRHGGGRANVLWLDGHAAPYTPAKLGYVREADGSMLFNHEDANNTFWSGTGEDVPWTRDFQP